MWNLQIPNITPGRVPIISQNFKLRVFQSSTKSESSFATSWGPKFGRRSSSDPVWHPDGLLLTTFRGRETCRCFVTVCPLGRFWRSIADGLLWQQKGSPKGIFGHLSSQVVNPWTSTTTLDQRLVEVWDANVTFMLRPNESFCFAKLFNFSRVNIFSSFEAKVTCVGKEQWIWHVCWIGHRWYLLTIRIIMIISWIWHYW